jgi:hypothetical protein
MKTGPRSGTEMLTKSGRLPDKEQQPGREERLLPGTGKTANLYGDRVIYILSAHTNIAVICKCIFSK